MRAFQVLLFVIAPIVLASTTHRWFWRLKYIRCLSEKNSEALKSLDDESVDLPSTKMTINQIRVHDGKNVGDKIVVLHHLKDIAEDTEDNIQHAMRLSILVSGLLVLFVAGQPDAIHASQHDPSEPILWHICLEGWHLLERFANFYAAPFGPLALTIWQIVAVALVRLQVRKYRSILPGK